MINDELGGIWKKEDVKLLRYSLPDFFVMTKKNLEKFKIGQLSLSRESNSESAGYNACLLTNQKYRSVL